ncbi:MULTISPECIES: class IIb bacteriocin, lactobin A/cerein 7B family [Marisediminitalea]|jgi:lactobin A/cerein 7B family class IIb bacteriocin|uniref:class IIb bacteriocin, lactobin A/cerein 7B family n=1 Tax=Marisediminitalea TaxID=2662254 RepID=UPI000C65E8E8|nr:class IIb bacteriocin, lactobin A/cerein 7B family [Marisediminitalea aggregata]MBL53535.1 hypothetical protein [Alteromonadaceae bacterium]MCP3865673.1 class IIb bacteriocin, lactobin A/cerein 7B family [Aestuariibacter sp.]MCP4237407.1 class IIb bacteriocin, lactobin A/cerein 7B family [Aestuariibacter sp.]MCP4525711.1 class IIb bacteriocin, lactobin A/cerein 7B family [Aestuariibacter sp.]MCP4946533.1 class IIb bacteriocin, lactobin A/cerein 7B family [Aestuariibacter sp.]|tara:strand:- start:426 stop:686 length:261 start_codon:yes stop_codon:yes gene_type:complete
MRELNKLELEEVNGGFGPAGAGFGALVGAVGYLGGASTSGNFSWGGLASATGAGALSGFVGGPVTSSVARFFLPRISFFGGAASSI